MAGQHSWYFGIHDPGDGLARAAHGAPVLLNQMDQPDGALATVSPDAEAARVKAMLASAGLAGGLDALLTNLVADSGVPWLQTESQELDPTEIGTKRFADVFRLGNLQLAALDPGLARYLGFADRIEDLPDLDGGGGWDALAVVGLFAIDFWQFDPTRQYDAWLQSPDANEGALIDLIVNALTDATGSDAQPGVDALIAWAKHNVLVPRAAVTVVAPVPPWLPPSVPTPSSVTQRWQRPGDSAPSSLYSASFAFDQPPLAAMAAVAAELTGDWDPRHGTVDVPGFDPPVRRTPRVLGHEQEAFSRARRLGLATASAQRAGLLSDQDLPADAGTITYRVRVSDLFGRFGDKTEFDIDPPPRPRPPPPVLRFHIDRTDVDLSAPGPVSPGTLRLSFLVRDPAVDPASPAELASAIPVPAIGDLAAGSEPVQQVRLELGTQSQLVDLTQPGLTEVDFDLPGLEPQHHLSLTLTGTFIDADNVESEPAQAAIEVTDRRAPPGYSTGRGLLWTSAPGPAPDAQLDLMWPAPAGSRHRVYATDQQGLGLTDADLAEPVPGVPPSRGRVAAVGANKVLGGAAVPKEAFRLLSVEPITADADNQARLHTTLPRHMETVQFLRVVPLSPEGGEAPFDQCGMVAVAVPDTRRPPLPELAGEVDPATGHAQLTITATGFDGPTLARDEPGLFTPGAAGGVAPHFRIRRAVGKVADPIYARSITDGPLTPDTRPRPDVEHPDVVFSGLASDGNGGRGLEPFVRYVYWAEVWMPPERRVPADFQPLDPARGIAPVDPVNAADHERLPSLPSAARVLMHVPVQAPAPLAPAAITATRGFPRPTGVVPITITIADPPVAHPKAIAPYRLAVWTQWPSDAIEPISAANGAVLDRSWPDLSSGQVAVSVGPPSPPATPGSPITLRLALVDPVGRLSGLTALTVT